MRVKVDIVDNIENLDIVCYDVFCFHVMSSVMLASRFVTQKLVYELNFSDK